MSAGILKTTNAGTESLHVPAVHIFHAKYDVPGFILKRAVEGYDIGRTAIMADLQFSKDLFSNVFFGIHADDLLRVEVSLQTLAECWEEGQTFLAMTTLVPACMTLLTVPPFPAPSSFSTTRSSLLKSNLNSRPISSVSVLLLSMLPRAPGICESPSEGFGALAGGALNARPLTFLRLSVLALKGSDIVTAEGRYNETGVGKVR